MVKAGEQVAVGGLDRDSNFDTVGGKTWLNIGSDLKTIVIDGIIHHISHISYINDMNCFAGCLFISS